jgi:hypothetical protein
MKVYCKNCMFESGKFLIPKNKYYYFRCQPNQPGQPTYHLNINDSCKYYKRKWYKFWIK